MNEKYAREIDLIDLLIDWCSHWSSSLAFLLVGVIAAGAYMYTGNKAVVDPEAIMASEKLSEMTAEQLSQLTEVEIAEKLTEEEINAVNELVKLNDEYQENLKLYDAQKDSLELKDRAEAFSYIASQKNIIESRKGVLTADQQAYYYYNYIEKNQVEKNQTEKAEVAESTTTSTGASKTKALLIVIIAIILHFMIFACRYIFSSKIKRTDALSAMVNVPEYTRMIEWSKVDSSKGLDSLVNKMRYANVRKTGMDEAVEINSSATIEKLKNKNYNSVAVIGTGIIDERNMLVNQLIKDKPDATVKSIDSITHSVNGADDIAGVQSAILAVKVGTTRYNDFFEELQSLKDREVDILGIAVFE